jgi:hypothetical protein
MHIGWLDIPLITVTEYYSYVNYLTKLPHCPHRGSASEMATPAVGSMNSGRAERVLIVSLMKSGTHILQELMTALGYGMTGSGVRLRPEILPRFSQETRWQIARLGYDDETLARLRAGSGEDFTAATDRAWEALVISWERRLAQPLASWYTQASLEVGFAAQVHRRVLGTDFATTPPGVCWVINQLDLKQVDGQFLHEWSETGEPRIIFNYRDPRDMLLSFVNFLGGKTGRGFSNYNDLLPIAAILNSKATLAEQLAYALTDRSFPGLDDYQRMLWLLHHPNVCTTSFEELIGPKGGGSAQAQSAALTRVFEFLGITDIEPAEVAGRLFNPAVFSFYRGQIGGWREAYPPALKPAVDNRFGEVLRAYGYE